MIDKKNFKMSRLALLVLSTLTLICETATSVRAQGSDNKIKVSTSHRCSATDSHNGMRAMFAFLRENIGYPSKAIEAKMQAFFLRFQVPLCLKQGRASWLFYYLL